VSAAFALGYGIGELGRRAWARLQPDEIAFRKANAFRAARLEFAEKYGRQPNPQEVRAMASGFLDSYEKARSARR
jgi:hypothetical protein